MGGDKTELGRRLMGYTAGQKAARDELFAQFCALRDGGMGWVDAIRDVGRSDSTGTKWEAAYKRLRGLEFGKRGPAWCQR